MYRVVVHRRAARYFRRLPQDLQARIRSVLAELQEHGHRLSGARQMRGDWLGYRRIRVGGLRIIFWAEEETKTIFVDHIGPRGDAYK